MAVTVPAGMPAGTTAQGELLPGRAVLPRDFVRLKLRLLRNGFRGQTWRIVLYILGALFGLWMGFVAFAGIATTGLLRGLPQDVVDSRAAELIDVLGLADAGRTLVVDYSAGMKKKIGLACALLHAPRLLVLDEPFEAVDPVSAALIRDILHRYVHSGGTVIFSSHVMEVVEKLCTHIAIMAEGAIKAVGTLADVRGGHDLEDVFVKTVGGRIATGEELSWL